MANDDAEPGEAAPETEVGKWLLAHKADKFVDLFHEKGFEHLADLTDKNIDLVLKKIAPGTASRLKREIVESREKPSKEGLKIPDLPAGTTLDLTQNKLKEPDGSVSTFTMPQELSAVDGKEGVVSPFELTPADWVLLVDNNRILFGYTMDDITNGQLPMAEEAVLDWVIPADRHFVDAGQGRAEVTTELCYSEQTANYVSFGFDKESASASYTCCSASFQREHTEKNASDSYHKTLFMFGRWWYPRAILHLRKCTRPSQRFIEALEDALAATPASTAVAKVLKDYGAAVPSTVILGGELVFRSTHTAEGRLDERKVTETIAAAVSVKVGAASGNVSVSTGTASDSLITSQSIVDTTSFTAIGGKTTLASTPKEWPDTVNPPKNWATIGREGLISTLDLLDDDPAHRALKAKVLALALPPAILPPRDLPTGPMVKHEAEPVFVLAARAAPDDGSGGSVSLVCSVDANPTLAKANAVGGAAVAHYGTFANMRLRWNSLCLPVPAKSYLRTDTHDTFGHDLPTRIVSMPTQLRFGAWQAAFAGSPGPLTGLVAEAVAECDGFLFVSIRGETDGVRGAVHADVDGKRLGSASVHRWSPQNDIQTGSSLCIPVPARSHYTVTVVPDVGRPTVRAWWLPSTNPAWRFLPADSRELNAEFTAETDGLLNARIWTAAEGDGGWLDLRSQWEMSEDSTPLPIACAAVQWSRASDRWFTHGAAVLPVQSGLRYFARRVSNFGVPPAGAYWTAIVPADQGDD